uniref:Fuseless [Apis mellifera] n=2 Tax=Lepeophtheirus salmonis TaxID=72036 RepID=A0A0K2UBS0_LEPSM
MSPIILKLSDLIILLLSSVPSLLFWHGSWWIWDHSVTWSISVISSPDCKITGVPSSFLQPWLFLSAFVIIRSVFGLLASLTDIEIQSYYRSFFLRIFLIIQSYIAVIIWKCVFDILQYMECYSPKSGYATALFLLPCLIIFKSTRNLVGNPVILQSDSIVSVYRSVTILRTNEKVDDSFKFTLVRLLDHLITNILNLIPVVLWWAVWELSESSFNMENDWAFIIVGYLLVIFTFVIEHVYFKYLLPDVDADNICSRIKYVCMTCIAFFASIFVWRGGWAILDSLVPETSVLPHILFSLIGLTCMLACNVANTLTDREFIVDDGRNVKEWGIVTTPERNFFTYCSSDKESEPLILKS